MVPMDVMVMQVPVAAEIEVVVSVAAVPPSPATKMMQPSWPAVHLVGDVGVFDGVTQAVRAIQRDWCRGLRERTGDNDGRGCNGHCKHSHGVLLIERADRPPIARSLHVYQALAQPFMASPFIACSFQA